MENGGFSASAAAHNSHSAAGFNSETHILQHLNYIIQFRVNIKA